MGPTQRFDWRALSQTYIGSFGTLDRYRPASPQPRFDFGQVPHHATRGQRETARELSALFHLINRAVSERYHLTQFLAPNCSGSRILRMNSHRAALSLWRLRD
ncbi:conserved hypothetical protein [Mesorhizobium plurifarium]|uniref:Uncharacterized protein n=1 Tax=Mesorhizobium plurifarium TaxID=69974 RepID=A0A090DAK9_MESPL|nr:conserved hypothetical protein [Mesorhizobium plurifarium]